MRTETFQTPGHVALDIRLGAGEVEVETGEVSETTVELEPLGGNGASLQAMEEARVEARERIDGHEVVVDVRSQRRFGRGPELRVRVSVPHGADLQCKTGSADIDGRGRFGSAEVESGAGEIQLGEVAGEAKANSASGDIQISTVGGDARMNTASGDIQIGEIGGSAKANSASGDILLREVKGELNANSASGDVMVKAAGAGVNVNTASGDQEIGAVQEGSVSLKSASGDLRVGIREGSRLYVDARSRSGQVSSELEVSGEQPEGDGPLVELRANTMSGDITIVRA